jgi:hypothetical protein
MLRDAALGARLQVSLLTAAVEDGIPDRLRHTSIGLVGGEVERLAGRLVADRGLAPANACGRSPGCWAWGRDSAAGTGCARTARAGATDHPPVTATAHSGRRANQLARVGRPGVELGLPAATGRAATGRWAPSTCRVGVVAPGRSGRRRRRRRRPGARRGGWCRLVLDAQRGDGLLGAGAAFARRAARGVLRGGGVPSVERYRPTSARRAAGGRGVRPRGRRGRIRGSAPTSSVSRITAATRRPRPP